MGPLEFLTEEFENTERALHETLRHDYGPGRREEYYTECEKRLQAIQADIAALTNDNRPGLKNAAAELAQVAHAIALVERSRLGEFSWPFADELREAASSLLTETTVDDEELPPIVHVISEPTGYKIRTEQRLRHATSRFVTIHFTRQLKHHVLLHALFGHELGHAAINIPEPKVLLKAAARALSSSGPMSSAGAMTKWIHDPSAPVEVRNELSRYKTKYGKAFQFGTNAYSRSHLEFVCDLFGLACFGPSFLAAHRVYLSKPFPYLFNLESPTHPVYACRHRMLVQALRLLGWDQACTTPADGEVHHAEESFLDFVREDPYDARAKLFKDGQIESALKAINTLFVAHPKLTYQPIERTTLIALVANLTQGVPPILVPISEDGTPSLNRLSLGRILFAGWTRWLGRAALTSEMKLSFFEINRLCDQALIQQAAINRALDRPRN